MAADSAKRGKQQETRASARRGSRGRGPGRDLEEDEDEGADESPLAASERRERSTFLSMEEILRAAEAGCASIADGLRAMQEEDEDERRRLALAGLEHRERELYEVLVAYREGAPDSLLRMEVQYVAAGPLDLAPRPSSGMDVHDATAYAVSVHDSLEHILASLAAKAVSEAEQEAFEALEQLIRASKSTLARVASGVHDL